MCWAYTRVVLMSGSPSSAAASASAFRAAAMRVPSQEEFEAFARERLRPTLQQVWEAVTPELTFFPRPQTDPGMSALETQPAPATGEFAIGGDLTVVRPCLDLLVASVRT
jgi:hypothetical protein